MSRKVETSIGEGGKIEGNPSMKKRETALAAAEKRKVSYSDSETKRKDPVADSDSEEKSRGGEETKKTTVERVWSDEDEIALLQGLLDYETVTDKVFYTDPDALYLMVKKSLSFDLTRCQFLEKIRKLSFTYHPNGRKIVTEEPTFAGPHDRKCFDLANSLWGPKRRFCELEIAHFARRRREENSG